MGNRSQLAAESKAREKAVEGGTAKNLSKFAGVCQSVFIVIIVL